MCERIEDAFAHSRRCHIPLLILVHSSFAEASSQSNNELLSDMYINSAGGKKMINPAFQLGGAALKNNGAAQRRALDEILKLSRLSSVTLVHFIEAGSAAHSLFTAAVPETSHVVPRLHIFLPSRPDCPRNVLHGLSFTAGRIFEAICVTLQSPPLAKVNEVKGEFMQQVEEMNVVGEETLTGSLSPLNMHTFSNSFVESNNTSATATSYGALPSSPFYTNKKSFVSEKTGGTSVSGTSFDTFHLIVLEGLEKKEAIVTSPGMTLSTIWKKVEKALLNTENVTTRSSIGSTFSLRVDPPLITTTTTTTKTFSSTVNKDNGVDQFETILVHSADAAANIDIHALPHNSVVTVVRSDDVAKGPRYTKESFTGSCSRDYTIPKKKKQESDGRKTIHCDNDACCIADMSLQKKLQTLEEKEEEEEISELPQANTMRLAESTFTIDVRCSLPDGSTRTIEGLDPTVATLSTHLRESIAETIGHNNFVFARVYPPLRFSSEDEAQPLQAIGFNSSSALRVITTGGAATGTVNTNQSGGLFGFFSLLRRDGVQARPPSETPAKLASAANTSVGISRTAPSGLIRTMADMRKKEEEEEKRAAAAAAAAFFSNEMTERAMEQLRKKANRYYGGNSTEYIGAEDNSDEEKEHEEGKKQTGRSKKKF